MKNFLYFVVLLIFTNLVICLKVYALDSIYLTPNCYYSIFVEDGIRYSNFLYKREVIFGDRVYLELINKKSAGNSNGFFYVPKNKIVSLSNVLVSPCEKS
jgi:hypothetical protein